MGVYSGRLEGVQADGKRLIFLAVAHLSTATWSSLIVGAVESGTVGRARTLWTHGSLALGPFDNNSFSDAALLLSTVSSWKRSD